MYFILLCAVLVIETMERLIITRIHSNIICYTLESIDNYFTQNNIRVAMEIYVPSKVLHVRIKSV